MRKIDTELEELKAALVWCLDKGAVASNSGKLHDHGCGCCSDSLGVPPEFQEHIAEAIRRLHA